MLRQLTKFIECLISFHKLVFGRNFFLFQRNLSWLLFFVDYQGSNIWHLKEEVIR